MPLPPEYLPEATATVAVALVTVTLAIAALRKLQKGLLAAAVVLAMSWVGVLGTRHKEQFPGLDLPAVQRLLRGLTEQPPAQPQSQPQQQPVPQPKEETHQ